MKPCESHDLARDSFHSSLLVLTIIDGELYALYLGEVLQSALRFLPPPATCLVTTEGRGVIKLVPTIHPHRAGLEALRDGDGLADASGTHTRGETELRVVRALHDLVDRLKISGTASLARRFPRD